MEIKKNGNNYKLRQNIKQLALIIYCGVAFIIWGHLIVVECDFDSFSLLIYPFYFCGKI